MTTPQEAAARQEILDQLEALGRQSSAAYEAEQARIREARKALQTQCGVLGHFFAKDRTAWGRSVFSGDKRRCIFCNCEEPTTEPTGAAAEVTNG